MRRIVPLFVSGRVRRVFILAALLCLTLALTGCITYQVGAHGEKKPLSALWSDKGKKGKSTEAKTAQAKAASEQVEPPWYVKWGFPMGWTPPPPRSEQEDTMERYGATGVTAGTNIPQRQFTEAEKRAIWNALDMPGKVAKEMAKTGAELKVLEDIAKDCLHECEDTYRLGNFFGRGPCNNHCDESTSSCQKWCYEEGRKCRNKCIDDARAQR